MPVESSAKRADRRPKRKLRGAALEDEQVQSPVTDAGNQARAIEADVAVLKKDVAVLKRQADSLNERFDSFRDEIVARLEASEERIKSQFQELRGEITELRAVTDTRFKAQSKEMDARFEAQSKETNARFDGLREEMNARFGSVEARLRIFAWLIGVGLTLYTGTTVSLMVLLFRAVI